MSRVDSVGISEYEKIHRWINNLYGRAKECEFCHCEKAKKYDWALLKNFLYEKKRENFIQLCRKCHLAYDRNLDTNDKISAAHLGKKRSAEAKAKMSMAHKSRWAAGAKRAQTPETRLKISIALKGVSHGIGKKLSEAHKAAIKSGSMKKFTQQEALEMATLYKKGLSLRKIAIIFNTSHAVIRNWIPDTIKNKRYPKNKQP